MGTGDEALVVPMSNDVIDRGDEGVEMPGGGIPGRRGRSATEFFCLKALSALVEE